VLSLFTLNQKADCGCGRDKAARRPVEALKLLFKLTQRPGSTTKSGSRRPIGAAKAHKWRGTQAHINRLDAILKKEADAQGSQTTRWLNTKALHFFN